MSLRLIALKGFCDYTATKNGRGVVTEKKQTWVNPAVDQWDTHTCIPKSGRCIAGK